MSASLEQALKHHQAGQFDLAENIYQELVSKAPGHADLLHYLGAVIDQQGRHAEGVEWLEKAVALKPADAEIHNNLGLALCNLGDHAKAVACFNRAALLDDSYTEAHYNLGTVLFLLKQPDAACRCFGKVAQQRPSFAEAHFRMGLCYQAMGRRGEEVTCYQQTVALRPNYPEAYVNLGMALLELGDNQTAENALRTATEQGPEIAMTWYNLAGCLQQQGKHEEASACFDRAYLLEKNPVMLLKKTLLAINVPILSDAESIGPMRARFAQEIEEWLAHPVAVSDPFRQISASHFFLAYHARGNRALNERVAALYSTVCPALYYVAPHCVLPRPAVGRIRIGVLSGFFRDHTISKLYQGMIEMLPREQFEVTVIRAVGEADTVTAQIDAAADRVIEFPRDVAVARELIAAAKLDVLFYTDMGMHAFTYLLGFARLAPVQAVGWGHPDTTGLPEMDYFLSQDDLEPAGAEKEYSETLVRLTELPCYYRALPTDALPRNAFDLPEDKHLYLCPQTLFKFHPDFDPVMAEILRRDPNGLIVLVEGGRPYWTVLLKERFARAMPDVAERILFLPQMPQEKFRALLPLADAVLDPVHFGGGNTHYEAFAQGVPVVTWPGEFMRGRIAMACYLKMGVDTLIARDHAHYIELALRLANDRPWREQLRTEIKARAGGLYENRRAIDEMADFFHQAVKKATMYEQNTTIPA